MKQRNPPRESSRIYSAFQEWTLKKKRTNAVESSSRKKIKHTAHNHDQENMKVLNLQQESEIAQKKTPDEDVDSSIQENEFPQDPLQNIFQKRNNNGVLKKTPILLVFFFFFLQFSKTPIITQKVLKEYGNVKEKDQWLDSPEDNNQVVMDTLQALTETLKDLHNELEQSFETGEQKEETHTMNTEVFHSKEDMVGNGEQREETHMMNTEVFHSKEDMVGNGEQREESHMMNTEVFHSKEDMIGNVTENTKSFVKVNRSTQTEDLDPREEELERRELEFQILKSQVISLNSINDQLVKKMKQCEDKEKASNELAERAMELVVSLKTKNEEDKEEEMKTLRMIMNEMEAIADQLQP